MNAIKSEGSQKGKVFQIQPVYFILSSWLHTSSNLIIIHALNSWESKKTVLYTTFEEHLELRRSRWQYNFLCYYSINNINNSFLHYYKV